MPSVVQRYYSWLRQCSKKQVSDSGRFDGPRFACLEVNRYDWVSTCLTVVFNAPWESSLLWDTVRQMTEANRGSLHGRSSS